MLTVYLRGYMYLCIYMASTLMYSNVCSYAMQNFLLMYLVVNIGIPVYVSTLCGVYSVLRTTPRKSWRSSSVRTLYGASRQQSSSVVHCNAHCFLMDHNQKMNGRMTYYCTQRKYYLRGVSGSVY